MSGRRGYVDDPTSHERATINDLDNDRTAVVQVRNPNHRAEAQRLVSCVQS